MTELLAQAEEVGALDNTVLVALIVAIGSLASTGIIAWATNRRERIRQETEAKVRREEKLEDWKRQDEVARRAEIAAEKVGEVADQTAKAADLLSKRQDETEAATGKAREDLVTANENLRKETRRAAQIVNGKLDQIHTLVNSNLSEAMGDRLTAIRALIVALQQSPDQSPAAVERIRALEATAIELEAQLVDRQRQTRVAEAQVEQGEEGAIKAEWEVDEEPPEQEPKP